MAGETPGVCSANRRCGLPGDLLIVPGSRRNRKSVRQYARNRIRKLATGIDRMPFASIDQLRAHPKLSCSLSRVRQYQCWPAEYLTMVEAASKPKNLLVTLAFIVFDGPGDSGRVSAGVDNALAGAAGHVGMALAGGRSNCDWVAAVGRVECPVCRGGTRDAVARPSD